jgi:hypothetical protein
MNSEHTVSILVALGDRSASAATTCTTILTSRSLYELDGLNHCSCIFIYRPRENIYVRGTAGGPAQELQNGPRGKQVGGVGIVGIYIAAMRERERETCRQEHKRNTEQRTRYVLSFPRPVKCSV